MPSIPFSDCSTMCIPAGTKFATSVGMPMPRFTYMPSRSSRAARWAIWSRFRAGISGAPLADGPLLDRFLEARSGDDALHVDAGRVDAVGLELAGLDQGLDLGDGDASRGRHHRVEVARGLSIDQVAEAIALPRLD